MSTISERVQRGAPLIDRVFSRVRPTSWVSCWHWLGPVDRGGYGKIWDAGRTRNAHRVAYELAFGPIGPGLELDHLCRVRSCVNPLHLEPVTPTENTRRGVSFAVRNAAKTHCPQGHPYDHVAAGARRCRICRRAQGRKTYAKNGRADRRAAA